MNVINVLHLIYKPLSQKYTYIRIKDTYQPQALNT